MSKKRIRPLSNSKLIPASSSLNKKSRQKQQQSGAPAVYNNLPQNHHITEEDEDERRRRRPHSKRSNHHRRRPSRRKILEEEGRLVVDDEYNAATMPTCRMLPHGSYSLIPAVLSSMAWLASLFQDGCDYSRLKGADAVSQLSSNPDVPWLEVGLGAYREPVLNTKTGHWEVVYTGQCYQYPYNIPQDGYWNAARGFDFFALVLGGGGTFFLWFTSCCVFSPGTWRMTGYEVLLAAIFQSLSFLWFMTAMCTQSGGTCELFWGSKADIIAASFWFVSAMSIFCYYPAPKDYGGGDGVWVEDSGASTTAPSVQMSDGALGASGEPTVTTAAAAATATSPETSIPKGTDDYASSIGETTETPAGESSHQESAAGRTATAGREKEPMRDIELT